MKKIFLLLFSFISVTVLAQDIVKTVTFDFNKPKSLNPALPTRTATANFDEPYECYSLVDQIELLDGSAHIFNQFFSDNIVLDFWQESNSVSQILFNNSGTLRSQLKVRRQGFLKVSSQIDHILKIEFKGDDAIGVEDGPDLCYEYGVWTSDKYRNPKNVSSVTFRGSGFDSFFDQIIVTYLVTRDVLTPAKQTFATGSVIADFSEFKMSYTSKVKLDNTKQCYIEDSKGNKQILSVVVEDNDVILKSDSVITLPGDYKLIIPEKSVSSSDDVYYNKAVEIPFNIAIPDNNFYITSVSPIAGEIAEIPVSLMTVFKDAVGGVISDSKATLYKNYGEEDEKVVRYLSPLQKGEKTVEFSFTKTPYPVTDNGIYTLVIPEGVVYDINYDESESDFGVSKYSAKYNPETKFVYYIGQQAPVDPVPPTPVDTLATKEVRSKADALLALSGVGYPSANSLARIALENLKLDAEATDENYEKAFEDFYNSNEIELPKAGPTYRIYNVAKNGSKHFLSYRNGSVGLSSSVNEACYFTAESVGDSKIVFKTPNNKYLHVLMSSGMYEGTSTANVTNELTEVNKIKLEKLVANGVNPYDIMGLVTMHGAIGMYGGSMQYAYSVVNTKNGTIEFDPAGNSYYDDTHSSAFCIEAADPPYVPFVTPYTLNKVPGVIDALDEIVITFPEVDEVRYSGDPAIILTHGTTTITPKSIAAVNGVPNAVSIKFMNIERGTYHLIAPKGALICGKDTVQHIDLEYTVSVGYDFKNDFVSRLYYQLPATLEGRSEFYTSDFNDIRVFDYDWKNMNLTISEGSHVQLRDLNQNNKLLATGKLVKSEIKETHEDTDTTTVTITYPALKLQFDKVFEEGDLPTSVVNNPGYSYEIVIEEAAFGDENYGKYLANSNSIDKTECHVNATQVFFFTIYPKPEDGPDDPSDDPINPPVDPEDPPVDPVDPVDPPVDPTPQEPIASDSIISVANSLMQFQGVGYPSANSEVRTKINALKNNDKATEKEYEAAIDEFYASAEISKPEAGKTYIISNIAKNGSAMFLSYQNGAITLSEKEEDACRFEAIVEGVATVFKTSKNKYLHGLTNTSANAGATTANLTDNKSMANNINVEKFVVSGVENKEVFGLVSLYGFVGVNNGKMQYSYSLVDTKNGVIDLDLTGVNHFDANLSSAFRIVEVEPLPDEPFCTPYEVDIAQGEVDVLNDVTIMFPELTEYVLYTASPVISLISSSGEKVAPVAVTHAEGKKNVMVIRFQNVEQGSYELDIPYGALVCNGDTIQAISLSYTVTVGSDFSDDFITECDYQISAFGNRDASGFVTSDMNDIRIYDSSWNADNIALADKNVILLDGLDNLISIGKLQKSKVFVAQSEDDPSDVKKVTALRIAFDAYFDEGDLATTTAGKPGCTYKVVIPAAAFGDANYGKYLADRTSVKKTSCHVNAELTLEITICAETDQTATIADVTKIIQKYLNQ